MAAITAASDSELQALTGTVLINGPAFSGKSALIMRIANPSYKTLIIGAGDASDPGLSARIADLRAARPAHWEHQPVQLDLANQLNASLATHQQIIVESINPWIARCLFAAHAAEHSVAASGDIAYQKLGAVCQLLKERTKAKIYLVTADVTADLSPHDQLPRLQRELCGRAVQHLGINCCHVVQMVAGLPILIQKTL